jgi:sortase A
MRVPYTSAVFRNPHVSAAVVAALFALAALSALPAALTAETGARPAATVSAKETSSEPPPKADKETKESALEKLSLKKLTLEKPAPEKEAPEKPAPEKPAPEKSAPAPEPAPDRNQASDQSSDKGPEQAAKAGTASEPAPSKPARKAPLKRTSKATPPAAKPDPSGNQLSLSVPRLGLENVIVGDSREQSYLNREGIMHLSGTGFPYARGSNTYVAGHAEGYNTSRVPHVFRNLEDLRRGDDIVLRDAAGRTYDYRVYQRLVVTSDDVWVTKPVAGKQIISLQTCFPAPTFDKRLIVRGELVG